MNKDKSSPRKKSQYYRLTSDAKTRRIKLSTKREKIKRYKLKDEKTIPDFSTEINELLDPGNLNFTTFESNIETAVVLYHLNRGIIQYHSLSNDINDKNTIIKLKK